MIELFSGTPGSGKSLHAARIIDQRLQRRNGSVISNYPVDLNIVSNNGKRSIGRFTYLKNEDLTVQYLKRYAKEHHVLRKENQTLLVIDEAGIMFNSREYASSDRKSWLDFFVKHRKLGYKIILIAQHDRMLDRQMRANIEYNVHHRQANNLGAVGMILSLFRIKTFVAVTYLYAVRNLRNGAEFFRYRKRDGLLYDTMMLFDDDEEEVEKYAGKPVDVNKAAIAELDPKNVLSDLEVNHEETIDDIVAFVKSIV